MSVLLDNDQNLIANHTGSNALVLAGAGSGKTATIIERCARLLESGYNPTKVIMLTFTNKAANEMSERLVSRLIEGRIYDMNAHLPNITTFHQFGYGIIRKYSEECFRPEGNPNIMNPSESKSEWIKAMEENGISKDVHKESRGYLQGLPGLIGDKGLSILDRNDLEGILDFINETDFSYLNKNLLHALVNYEQGKSSQNLLDFNDLIIIPIFLLKNNEEIRKSISSFLADITVDEAQDNNEAQYELLKLISDNGKVNTMMVGDDDQSIYEWRGAAPKNMKDFLELFDAKVFKLLKNYRSNADIVDGATNIVRNNKNRFEKNPYAIKVKESNSDDHSFETKKESDSIFFSESDDVVELGKKLAKHFLEKKARGESLEGSSILYRVNRIGFFIDKALTEVGIKTKMLTGTGLMERKEVLLAIAALRLVNNENDRLAFKRISSSVPGLGDRSVSQIIEQAKQKKVSVFDNSLEGLTTRQVDALNKIKESLNELREIGPEHITDWSKKYILEWIMKESKAKIKQQERTGKISDNEDHTDKIQGISEGAISNIAVIETQIRNALSSGRFDKNKWDVLIDLSLEPPTSKPKTLEDAQKQKDLVILSTIHSYKGLEADEVHIAGFSDGIMPSRNEETREIENPEEERRLAYVATTRAVDKLYLHHIKNFDFISGGVYKSAKTRKGISPYILELRGIKSYD